MKIIKETETYIVIDWSEDGTSKSKENKYLCIGGPLDGQMKSDSQVHQKEFSNATIAGSYVGYNCADNIRWHKTRYPKKVWVHKSITQSI
jgi:hypothetical protein